MTELELTIKIATYCGWKHPNTIDIMDLFKPFSDDFPEVEATVCKKENIETITLEIASDGFSSCVYEYFKLNERFTQINGTGKNPHEARINTIRNFFKNP